MYYNENNGVHCQVMASDLWWAIRLASHATINVFIWLRHGKQTETVTNPLIHREYQSCHFQFNLYTKCYYQQDALSERQRWLYHQARPGQATVETRFRASGEISVSAQNVVSSCAMSASQKIAWLLRSWRNKSWRLMSTYTIINKLGGSMTLIGALR